LRAGDEKKGAAKAAPGNLKRMGGFKPGPDGYPACRATCIVEDSAARLDQAFARHPVARPYPALAAADLAWVDQSRPVDHLTRRPGFVDFRLDSDSYVFLHYSAESNAPVGNSFSIGSKAE
jgi:hypothetical protein